MAFQRTYDPNVPDDAMIPAGAARRMDAGRQTADARQDKTENKEQYVTLGEVQAVINSLVDSIKGGFVTKADHLAVVNNLNRYIAVLQSKIPSEIKIKETARKQIPTCLRDLEQAGRQGNVLMLEPGGSDGEGTDKDSAYWGTVKEGSAIPNGTALLPHLQWNLVTGKWEIALISGTYDVSWCFSMKSISGFAATFYGGPVIKGTTLVGTAPETPVTITATGQIAYVVYTMSSGAISFGVANAENFPISASGTYIKALQSFTLTGSTIVPLLTYHRGVIQIDGVYA
jgi:hypothetical protein